MDPPPTLAVPRIDTSTSWLSLEDEALELRLIVVVAQVLGIDKAKFEVHHSFKDLGGDEQSAVALSRACMHAGMHVEVDDILRCSTLAELQTCIGPRAGLTDPVDTIVPVMIAPLEIHKPNQLSVGPDTDPDGGGVSIHSRKSSLSSSKSPIAQPTEIEQALGAHNTFSRLATVRPKAGLLEGKLVALLTLSSTTPAPARSSALHLIPRSQAVFAGTLVAALRDTAQSLLPPDSLPDIWICLDGMPLTKSGDLDMRRLRTWVQNINHDTYQRALSLESQEALQAPTSVMEKSLQRLVSETLSLPQDQIGMNLSFRQLGGDEMTATVLAAACTHESIYLNAAQALNGNTLSELAAFAALRGGRDEETRDCFDLSPMQYLYFQTPMGGNLEQRAAGDGCYRFNSSLLLKFKRHFTLDEISGAIMEVVRYHPMLRSRFSRTIGRWKQKTLTEVAGSYMLSHHSISSERELEAIIEHTQISINVETGPVFAANYISTDDGQQMIYLAAHHLAVDLLSWGIVLHDLNELLVSGSLLPKRSMPFHKWVDLQKSDQQRQGLDIAPFAAPPADYVYWGLQDVPNTYGDAAEVTFSLSQELTSILESSCNLVFNTDRIDIYLATLLLSFAQTFPDRPVPVVWHRDHGRESSKPGVDISETVGWFTSLTPVNQKVETSDDFITVLRRLKDTRRAKPASDPCTLASGFYNHDTSGLLSNDGPFEIIFGYAGSLQNLERDSGVMELLSIPGQTLSSSTSDIGPDVGRLALFEINAIIDDGSAKVKVLYNKYSRNQSRILQWVQNYEHLLLEAIGRLRYHTQELTLTDVPHLNVTYEGLATFNSQRLKTLGLTSVRDVDTIYPVTAVQQSILISQAQRPDTCYLHAIYEFASPSGTPIDISRICTAWQHVTARHSALRTVFTESVSESGLYDAIILRRASPEMLFIDIAPTDDPVYELGNLPNLRPTDNKPLHRLTVCKAPTRTFIKLDISTALCDSTSIHILLHDLRRAYLTERPIPDSAKLSYPHYLHFLRENRQEETSIAFWCDRLASIVPCLFPRLSLVPEERRFVSACLDLDITSLELSAFSRSHKTTTAAVLRLAWGLVLRCFTGRDSVCFGYQTSGRDDSVDELLHAGGSFANTVACNYELDSYSLLSSMLQVAEEQMEASLPHQHFTVAEIQHAMGTKGGERLFNSCLTFTEEPAGLNSKFTTRTSFELKPVSLQQTFDMDIVMNTRYSSGKLVVDIGQRIMTPEQALDVANTFGKAIQAILAIPKSSVGMVNLFSDRDYAQIVAWNADSTPTLEVPAHSVIHGLIAKQAALQPGAQAVCSWDGAFTYRELEDTATRLAHHLVDLGVGPNSVVPVVMHKSRLAPVAMLAVLKSGAAFVPIDALDLGMIQPIFERLNSRVAIASGNSARVLGNLFEKVVIVTEDMMTMLPEGQGSLTSMATSADPACILFVPVSLHEARGVSFSHAALSAALLGQGPAAQITSLSRVMQLSSFNVDICISEIFTTLVHGGCVCVPSASERLQDFTGAVNRMQVNWTYMTPVLSRKVDPTLLPTLRVVCFRTRSLDVDTYTPWHKRVTVILAYGSHDVCPLGISFLEAHGTHHLRSIGRPFCGSLIIVNPDDHKKCMPIGAVGELVVEGPSLGCAYPNRESMMGPMTPLAAGFGPLGRKVRSFRTGHRARYMEGGLMEFISSKRDDADPNMMDIEQSVRRCLGQGIDVLVDTLTFRGNKDVDVLVAFIELGDTIMDGEDDLADLSQTTKEQVSMAKQLVEMGLKNMLPSSKIPEIFIPVSHFPITASLKVNRRRLHKILHGVSREQLLELCSVSSSIDAKSHRLKPLPLTQNEELMRRIWADVLGIDEATIGANDTFFGVGGNDILAAEVMIACRHEGISLPISELFRASTLTEVCRGMVPVEAVEAIEEVLQPAACPHGPGAEPSPASMHMPTPPTSNPIKDALVEKIIAPKIGVQSSQIVDVAEASAVQIRYIETGMLAGRANINFLVFNFTGSIDSKKVEEACLALVVIHPILRTAFVPFNRRVYQAVLKSPDIEFKRHSCPTWRLSSVLDKTIRKDQSSPIAFCSPMTKFTFLDGGKQSTLIIRLSKAQYDDLSVALLVKDMKKLYDSTINPPHRPSHCDFMRCAQIMNSQGAEEYWRSLLEGAVMTQIVAHVQPYQVSTNIKTLRHLMPIGSLSSLGISFETILKAAWAMVLATLSGSSDIVFGELVDGRHVRLHGGHPVAAVMGPTINTIPVRVRFSDTALTPLSLLQAVHSQRISGIPFENLGALNIVEKCTPWPYWTRFSTLVQHQYEDTAINPYETKVFHLGSASCKFIVVESKAQDIPDLFIRSTVRGTGRVELSMSFCGDRVPEPFAEHALRMLCATIGLLTSVSIMQPIVPYGHQYRDMPKEIPLPQSTPVNASTIPSSSTPGDTDSLSAEHTRAIQHLISQTWTSVLNPRVLGVPEDQVHNAAFFDLWGSLIPAAQLAAQLNRELDKHDLLGNGSGLKVTMEEIVDNPTMLKQFELIAGKIRAQSGGPAQKNKDKEKEKEKDKESNRTRSETPNPTPAPSQRKKAGVNLSVSTVALGNRIRRLASTVVRSSSPPLLARSSSSAQQRPTTSSVVRTGAATATVVDKTFPAPGAIANTDTETASTTTSSQTIRAHTVTYGAPQLPNLPAFGSITEEPEAEFSGALMPLAKESPHIPSSAASMTDGSSMTSNGEADGGESAIGPMRAPPSIPLPALPAMQSPLIRVAEEEDLVSPLSAAGSPRSAGGGGKLHFFESKKATGAGLGFSANPTKPATEPEKSDVASTSGGGFMGSLRKKRSFVFGKSGLSSVVG
ncbi:hypothetical protein B0T19DRAFT_293542 [Cercophora scortea]|uniref:Carrier domain-containing protein n=1 Tax=Cercophora scortea TaxID=314031 RepID=A0AAE0I2T6_9PEZI|nr:hypothetical protein B0T19DRAFT_293542 [Cercophora scortea]